MKAHMVDLILRWQIFTREGTPSQLGVRGLLRAILHCDCCARLPLEASRCAELLQKDVVGGWLKPACAEPPLAPCAVLRASLMTLEADKRGSWAPQPAA